MICQALNSDDKSQSFDDRCSPRAANELRALPVEPRTVVNAGEAGSEPSVQSGART